MAAERPLILLLPTLEGCLGHGLVSSCRWQDAPERSRWPHITGPASRPGAASNSRLGRDVGAGAALDGGAGCWISARACSLIFSNSVWAC